MSLSADGRLAAAIRRPAAGNASFDIDVIDVDTGRIAGRATVATGGGIVPQWLLTPDGRALVTAGPDRGQSIEFVRAADGAVKWIRVVGRIAVRDGERPTGQAFSRSQAQ